jgi:putative addiction module killer protein/probable addiction module antidote protein
MFEISKTEVFEEWIVGLRDKKVRDKIFTRIDRIVAGNFGDHNSVGDGVSEMRINYGPGYRLYYTIRGQKIIFLLCGGDKARHCKGKGTEQRGAIMAKVKVTPWDTSEYLKTQKDIDGYLAEAFEDGDPVLIRIAMANVAKARNMTQLANEMGISRDKLYKMFSSEDDFDFGTIQKFLSVVGAKLTVVSNSKNSSPRKDSALSAKHTKVSEAAQPYQAKRGK